MKHILSITMFVGLVMLTGTTISQTAQAAGPTCSVAPSGGDYTAIQAAVDDTGCSTINVSVGTFSPFTVNRPLTINGAQAGIAPTTREFASTTSESIIGATSTTSGIVINSGFVIINGFDIVGDLDTNVGVAIDGASAALEDITIANNFVRGMGKEDTDGKSYGIKASSESNGVFGSLKGLNILNNTIFDIGGITSGSTVSQGVAIHLEDIVDPLPGNGAFLSGNIMVDIRNGHDGTNDQFGTGIRIGEHDASPSQGVLIQNNGYANTSFGIVTHGTLNTILGEKESNFANIDLSIVNLENTSAVDELTLGTFAKSLAVSAFETDFPGTVGYARSLQKAIDHTEDSSTVQAGTGIFSENIVINKPLTLESASEPVLEGDGTGIGIDIASINVIVRELTIKNFDTGVRSQLTSGVKVKNNNIFDNNSFGVRNIGSGTLNAKNNFWGACNGPSGAGSGSGDAVSANVNFTPWKSCDTISGFIYDDMLADGIFDLGTDLALEKWEVSLYDSGNVLKATTTSDKDGLFSFFIFDTDTYRVEETLQNGWATSTPSEYFITGTLTNTDHYREFGNYRPGIITGTVYDDTDGNGEKFFFLEPGLEGWKVKLKQGGITLGTATSNEDGNYVFANIFPGTYVVKEVVQPDWHQTEPLSPNKYIIDIVSGSVFVEQDFGNFKGAQIHGVKYHDFNGNGVRDPGEPGLEDWTINLSGTGGFATSTVTNVNGEYAFLNLGPNTYTVTETDKPGWSQSEPKLDSYTVKPKSSEVVTGMNFGNYKKAKIKGNIYQDLNFNGTKDGGEPGLPNWTIELIQLQTGKKTVVKSKANGNYTAKVSPGTYLVREIVKAGYIPINPRSTKYTVSVTSNGLSKNNNFGNNTILNIILNGGLGSLSAGVDPQPLSTNINTTTITTQSNVNTFTIDTGTPSVPAPRTTISVPQVSLPSTDSLRSSANTMGNNILGNTRTFTNSRILR